MLTAALKCKPLSGIQSPDGLLGTSEVLPMSELGGLSICLNAATKVGR
jgi:hypothetical protein